MRPPVFAFAALVCLTASLAVVPGASAAATSSQHRQAQNAHVPGHRTAYPTFRSIAASLQSARSATPAVAQAHAAIPKVDQAALDQRPAADGTVAVAITGDNRQVARRVTALGGQVLASTDRAVSAMIAPDRVGTLAADPAVSRVSRPERAYPTGVTSEGVGLSGATQWLSAGDTGTGQTIGIVDAGFANLSSEVAAGNLPAGQIVSSLPSGHGCTATQQNASQHGTAVAEIVHQMAPDAQLVLYCIQDTIGFADAEAALQAANVKIVTSSLGFAADSRGDGSGPAGSAAATVATARKAGILWIQSAGNNAQDHWSGRFRRDSASGLAELDGTAWEADGVFVAAGGGADLVVQWDQWPVSSSSVNLLAYGWQCTDTDCTHKVPIHPVAGHPDQASPVRRGHVSGQQPTVVIPVTNTAAFDQEWDVVVQIGTTTPAVGYELSYWGDVSPSNLAWYDSPSRAAAGSVSAPANSPYALAVGAADVSNQALEPFSSQGPTIDGRAKPDLVGWDGVSSNLSDFSTGFFGTSAAAPHVAGAAALVAGLHPNWDAAQLQNYLEQTASSGGPHNPPVNTTGHGLLTLGAPASSGLPVTSRYQELGSPVRILDTRPGQLPAGNKGPLGAKGT
ncbi:MAG: hypothetical protein JWO57_2262, partial [Pseudonocardiales bacterium]|nr:hypothetical protein [Pseudonocardiales bacterium]